MRSESSREIFLVWFHTVLCLSEVVCFNSVSFVLVVLYRIDPSISVSIAGSKFWILISSKDPGQRRRMKRYKNCVFQTGNSMAMSEIREHFDAIYSTPILIVFYIKSY